MFCHRKEQNSEKSTSRLKQNKKNEMEKRLSKANIVHDEKDMNLWKTVFEFHIFISYLHIGFSVGC